MFALRELQTTFRRAILEGDERAAARMVAEVEPSGLPAQERLAVYRNNVFAALSDTLRETFPVVLRLVDARFFSYVAHEFIRAHPPSVPTLTEYGGTFPDFLASFPPCRDLVYLPDVARLEWLMNLAALAPDEPALAPAALSAIASEQAGNLGVRLAHSYCYLDSPWPIDRIWRANQEGAGEETIALGAGGACLEVSRRNGIVMLRAMDKAEFAFRAALSAGLTLADALDRALAADHNFPAQDALAALFREGAVAVLTPSP
jgi:Putative DNA-binding domain